MMTTQITSCLEKFKQLQKSITPGPKALGKVPTVGEVYTVDDHESVNFKGYNNKNRNPAEIKKWAIETQSLAKKSLLFHVIEVPLKIISNFISQSEYKDSWLGKIFFAIERFFDTLGGSFRNEIYAHKDTSNKLDDNLGAEEHAESKESYGDHTTIAISKINHFIQTKARFLIPLIGLFSPTLANEIDWNAFGMFESIRWKRTASNSAFYPGFLQDVVYSILNKFTKSDSRTNNSSQGVLHPWKFAFGQLKKHFTDAKSSWNESNSTNFYKSMDQVTSAFLSFSQWPNIIGDVLRPLARRLEFTGAPRNIIRILSIIDRPVIWANYLFRFYLPERQREKEKDSTNSSIPISPLYSIGTVADIIDFTSTLFEDRIKELEEKYQYPLLIIRTIKSSALKLFFSGRRYRISQDTLNDLNKSNSN